MGPRRMGYKRPRKKATVGDIVICVDEARRADVSLPMPKKFIGLVLDKSTTVYKIQVLDTGKEIYWPEDATYLWKETQ
jgi:hypothetical protein